MAAFFRSMNAKIRAHPVLNYVCSTHFWGPVSNFGIPIAAIADAQKSPELISGTMTGALTIYSATFMRYALAVSPRNYLLFLCHFVNEGSQLTQGYRWLQYHKLGGKEEIARKAKEMGKGVKGELVNSVRKVQDETGKGVEKGKEAVGK